MLNEKVTIEIAQINLRAAEICPEETWQIYLQVYACDFIDEYDECLFSYWTPVIPQ